jgi:hypothetical protein
MIEKEMYFFDCWGLYLKRKAFDPKLIEDANYAFENQEKTQKGIKFYGVWEKNKTFIEFLANKYVKKICQICFGAEYRLDHAFIVQQNPTYNMSSGLHGKCFGKNMTHYYISQGQDHVESPCWTRTGQLSVGVVLKGQDKTTGGFCYLKGSHKSSYFLSGQQIKGLFMQEEIPEEVEIPTLEPGDLVAMPENLIHGQTKMNSGERRMVYNMFFPVGIKFMNFSEEYKSARSLTNDPHLLNILSEPKDILATTDSKAALSPYKPIKKNMI